MICKAEVNAMLLPYGNEMTDPCDILFPGLAINLIEVQHFDDDFPVVVPSNPNFRISATTVFGFILVAGDVCRVWKDAVPPADSCQVAGARRSMFIAKFTCSQNLFPVRAVVIGKKNVSYKPDPAAQQTSMRRPVRGFLPPLVVLYSPIAF